MLRDLEEARTGVHPHDHAVVVYDDMSDLVFPLDHFVADGLKANDLSVFVHSFEDGAAARAFLAKAVSDVEARERAGDVSAAHYRDAFERSGRIDRDHVAGVVEMLRLSANSSGRRAPRVFVDASKNYLDAGRVEEWFAFERWLGPRLHAAMGLVCAYRARDLRDPDVLRRVLETHAYRFEAAARR